MLASLPMAIWFLSSAIMGMRIGEGFYVFIVGSMVLQMGVADPERIRAS